ncbi:MAG TPA: hypothetical protein VGO93_13300 [Candidatus Xenobia bacterium]|jgi:hypothetical protein
MQSNPGTLGGQSGFDNSSLMAWGGDESTTNPEKSNGNIGTTPPPYKTCTVCINGQWVSFQVPASTNLA